MREANWWTLPGPGSFIESITDSLRDGNCVVVRMPQHAPQGLIRAIREDLGSAWQWHRISCDKLSDRKLIHELFARFSPLEDSAILKNVSTLVQQELFCGMCLCLSDIPPERWPEISEFIDEYREALKGVDVSRRTLFVVITIGEVSILPKEDVCLTVKRYINFIDSYDMLFYVGSLMRNSRLPILQRRIAISVIARLSGTDAILAERLTQQPLEVILNPMEFLKDFGKMLGWDNKLKPEWHNGASYRIDGRKDEHVAYEALCERESYINRRIWAAQVGILLPFVEMMRTILIGELAGILTVPFIKQDGGTINDISELEIGHIFAQLCIQGSYAQRDVKSLVFQLKEIRNNLAHLDHVPHNMLTSDELNEACANRQCIY